MSRKLRVGLIGAGGIAGQAHTPGYVASGRVELVAAADVKREAAEEAVSGNGYQRAYESFEEMLDKEELDAVSVCTPNRFHAGAVNAALDAGCHVICEKPPAIAASEVEGMVDTAERNGKILTFGLNWRYAAETQALKRFIEAGELGEIYAARVDALRRRGIPGWGVFTNKELQGGGPLIDIGVHMLDAALYLMGYPKPVWVSGATYQKIGNRPGGVGMLGDWDWEHFEVEDLAMAMIRFDDGATILLETSFAANIEPTEKMAVSLRGTDGGADLAPLKLFKEMHGGLFDLTPAWIPPVEESHLEQMKAFVDACLDGGEPMVKGHQAIRLQQILESLYHSAQLEKPIALP